MQFLNHLDNFAGLRIPRTSLVRPWRELLPPEWQARVIAPVRFATFREDELEAERCFGHSSRKVACYYSHRYRISELRSDDDEDFYIDTLYGEVLHAWLLHDGRWLVHRRVHDGELGEGRAFYSFSRQMPR